MVIFGLILAFLFLCFLTFWCVGSLLGSTLLTGKIDRRTALGVIIVAIPTLFGWYEFFSSFTIVVER